jgi:hypothetical protein
VGRHNFKPNLAIKYSSTEFAYLRERAEKSKTGRGTLMLRSILTALVLASMVACQGSGDLSREEAAKLLDGSNLFTPSTSFRRDMTVALGRLGKKEPGTDCIWPTDQATFPRKVLTITGIAQTSPLTRRVEFTWTWATPPDSPLSKCLPSMDIVGYPGDAEVQRYDDGWRVVAVGAPG